MASPRIEYAVLPAGDGPGQDRCFITDGLVVVLDGASAYDSSVSPDASEYVDTLGPALVEQITSQPDIDLREALARAIRLTAEKLALIPGKGPSSTVSIVRWGHETVDVLVLGDSPVVLHLAEGRGEMIVQHPMDHIAPELRRRYRERLASGYGYDDEHRAILARLQQREAPLRNREGGYWIAEAVDQAAFKASIATWPSSTVKSVVAATDGAALHLPSVDGYAELSQLSSCELREVLVRYRQWESTCDRNGKTLPRSKRHDDKAVAVVTAPLSPTHVQV